MTDLEEVPLDGGKLTLGVVRVGDTVRRPRTESPQFSERLLHHLDIAGFKGAPQHLGIDDQGRDILSYIPSLTSMSTEMGGAGGAFVSGDWSSDVILVSARWGSFGYRSETEFMAELGLEENDPSDLEDFRYIFESEGVTITYSLRPDSGDRTGEEYVLDIYQFPPGTGRDDDRASIPILDASPVTLARNEGASEDVAAAYRVLVSEARELGGPFALVAYCPPSDTFTSCQFRLDAEYAVGGTTKVSNIIKEEGLFVDDDDDSFFGPSYWGDFETEAVFASHGDVSLSVACTEM